MTAPDPLPSLPRTAILERMNLGNLNNGERVVLAQIARAHPEEAAIRVQLAAAQVTSRSRNSHGFFTYLHVPRDAANRISSKRPIADVWAHVRGLERGMTFLLWADDDGFLDCLEGAGLGEDIDVIDFDAPQIEFYEVLDGQFSGFHPPPPSWSNK